jgi:hypothetical protein
MTTSPLSTGGGFAAELWAAGAPTYDAIVAHPFLSPG